MLSPSEANRLTLNGLLSVIRRRRFALLAPIATCFFLAVLVCIFMTRMYKATGTIQIARTNSDGLGLDSMLSPTDISTDALSESMSLQTQATILKSDTLALQVIENLNLEHNADFQPKWNPLGSVLGLISPKGPKDPVNASLADSPARRTRLLKTFASHLKVDPVAGTRLIDIVFYNSDPKIAAAVVNQLTAALVSYSFQARNAATAQGTQWLGGQLDEVKQQAEALQARVVQLQRDAGVYSLGATDSSGKDSAAYSLTLDRLQQGTQALTAAESTRIVKGEIYEMVKSKDPELISGLAGSSLSGASPGVMNSFNLIQTLRSQEATLESQIATDNSKFGPAYPKLKDEQASLASVKQQIKDESNRIGERAENDFRVAVATENALRDSYNRDKSDASKLNDKAIQYTIAQQEATQARQLYETLFQHMKEAGVMQGLQSTDVTVVDPGRVPAKPNKPNVLLYLAASIVAGLFFGSIAALYVDIRDDSIRGFKPVERELQIPLLGVVPNLGEDGQGFSLPVFKQKRLPQLAKTAVFPRLAVIEYPGSPFAEALRALRTSLELPRNRQNSPPKVIVVTSAAPQEGKSTVSANLAALLALSGEKVLLVDGDMRKPSLATYFGLSGQMETGVSTLLSGNGFPRERPIYEVHSVPGLNLLSSGPVPKFPSELLGKRRMQNLVDDLRPDFDRILIDSPPVLAVTDATILSHCADLTLLVVREELTTLRSLRRAHEILAADGTSELGVVLNAVSRWSDSYHDYCGYSGDSNEI